MTGEYKTCYDGDVSGYFPKIEIKGHPRSKQLSKDPSTPEQIEWKEKIVTAINKKLKRKPHFFQVSKKDKYNLYLVFKLYNGEKEILPKYRKQGDDRKFHNPYENMDIDNLLKIPLDAIKKTSLIEDDRLIKGIKAYIEPVKNENHIGLSFQCITTKTFFIEDVETKVEGEIFMPEYWKSKMQYITATDSEGNRGTFIDNSVGRIFIAKNNNQRYPDAIPGYDWSSQKKREVSGCMVFERKHVNEETGDSKNFFWLQKWAWW